jgi:4-diphosphocytidyl-2-C-methyl-D-erythritol kinase
LVHPEAGQVRVLAHAKVNLFLAVGPRRPDGYHDVATVMQALRLADTVTVVQGGEGLRVSTAPDLGIPQEQNLAYAAALASQGSSASPDGVSIRILKVIPAGAGLGGGSADAAAVLVALSDRRPGEEPSRELMRAAAHLGADVPFFLGSGTQMMGGRGDEPIEVLPTPRLDIALVNPGVPVPTGAAYAQLDRRMRRPAPPIEKMTTAICSGDPSAVAAALHNDMTDASCSLVPEIRVALRFLEGSPGVLGAAMAGSGSTVFAVCADAAAAAECAARAEARGWWARATASAESGLTRS